MKITNHQQSDERVQRTQANCNELAKQITRIVHDDGVVEALPGLKLSRCSAHH